MSWGLLFPRADSKVPRRVDVFFKLTAAADVAADGYTINQGADMIATVTRTAEGVMLFTLKHPFKNLACYYMESDKATAVVPNFKSTTPGSKLVDVTWVQITDGSTAKDPDSCVIFGCLTLNTSSNAMK